jgi:hypothetical protein
MPVEGLPSALEGALTSLLQENPLSSFKIDGRPDSTVVIIRFTRGQENNMATSRPTLQRSYRTKPPSQLHRDRKRAEQYMKEKVGDSRSTMPLFQPTPPSTQFATPTAFSDSVVSNVGLLASDTITMSPLAASFEARKFHEVRVQSGVDNNAVCGVSVGLLPPDQLIDKTQLQAPAEINNSDIDTNSSDDGEEPPPGTVEYIDSIKDRSLIRRLKDKRRNKAFRKTVLDTSSNTSLLLCDSDDIVVMCDCTCKRVHHWFIKQPSNNDAVVERTCLHNLASGDPPDTGTYTTDVIGATSQLGYLSTVIRRLLG